MDQLVYMLPETLRVLDVITAHPGIDGGELRKLLPEIPSRVLTTRMHNLLAAGYIESERVPGRRACRHTATGRRPEMKKAQCKPGERRLDHVAPPRQPDTWQPWSEPYLRSQPGRRDAFDFRAVPSLRNGRRHYSQER